MADPGESSQRVEVFGDYRLDVLLGRGGMGEVWRAVDLRRDRTVALKRLHGELAADPEYQERFRREARLAARLNSPHVVPIHDFGEIEGRLFLDMRFVAGRDLSEHVAEGPMAPAATTTVITQIAGALGEAHSEGLVHRDVKPSNILLAAGSDYAYLVDFGIVRALDGSAGTSLTATGVTVGTLLYMAPELLLEDRPFDHRVDIYALGCTLYQMLTGRPPFDVQALSALLYHHINVDPPKPSDHGVLGFDHIVAKAMAKRPEDRYDTCQALTHDLNQTHPQAGPADPLIRPTETAAMASIGRPDPLHRPNPDRTAKFLSTRARPAKLFLAASVVLLVVALFATVRAVLAVPDVTVVPAPREEILGVADQVKVNDAESIRSGPSSDYPPTALGAGTWKVDCGVIGPPVRSSTKKSRIWLRLDQASVQQSAYVALADVQATIRRSNTAATLASNCGDYGATLLVL